MTKKPFAGVYEKMEFPEYKFQEYPKMVALRKRGDDGKPLTRIVNNHREELAALDEIEPLKAPLDTSLADLESLKRLREETDRKIAELEVGQSPPPKPSPTIKVPEPLAKPSAATP